MVNQFKWLCKMVAVCNNNLRVIMLKRNDDPLTLFHRVNFITIYDDPDI